ncbi:MAG: tRNA uridine(34) 5-carboxymethylaminomethyl modification radical SAM/GNAT enzyme Elp3 [Chloroflexi bacterium]|nr:tRNA uridine(34) 5-carboxymethylaminomethyl modification radical SAM/GNAT enzyme Elp3 [Chloroflexota bacterium]
MIHRAPRDLAEYSELLEAILADIRDAPDPPGPDLSQILRQHPLPDGRMLSKPQVLRGYVQYCGRVQQEPDLELLRYLRVKPTRTISGVAPVTVLTKPYPCPGECIFCPTIEHMPKSYLPDEPGAMRAASHEFDPFRQTASRITALTETGHNVDKVELLVLGGSWSSYPADYQEWFVRRCLDALNEVDSTTLEDAQRMNESAARRNVGLVVETRPDQVTLDEVMRLRRLGVTKVQVGVQSLDDHVLTLNRRGHSVADMGQAMRLLRLGGFKIVAHWMPNLLGATPEGDLADFRRLWDNLSFRPDELKIYPTSLLSHTVLYDYWERGEYQPYDEATLVELLARCKVLIPPYCRVNRLMRDIPAPNIVAGVKKSNLRQIVRQYMEQHDLACRCIRCREIRGQNVDADCLSLNRYDYATDVTQEVFLSYNTQTSRIAGFARLSLPHVASPVSELAGCATIREVHVYGPALELGDRQDGAIQHAGLGTALIETACDIARNSGYRRLAVIAAVGTRGYYRSRGFELGDLYMTMSL